MSAAGEAALLAHLGGGATHVCQCWAITRSDGVTFGFTDHDRPLAFDGIAFLADSGLAARALALGTGLSVDNTEALGLLQAAVITEGDIAAGRYDGAMVRNWLVRWDDVTQRQLRFRGRIGEITRQAGQFQAELRGLSDGLDAPSGRTVLRTCDAHLGDARCGVDLDDPAYGVVLSVLRPLAPQVLLVDADGAAAGWFTGGRATVLSGAGQGLSLTIKRDQPDPAGRRITLAQGWRAPVATGDRLRLVVGCDRQAATCGARFGNLVNFRGFPDMPGDDWLLQVPRDGVGA